MNSQQLHVKLQSGVGRDHATGATRTVTQFSRNDQGALTAHLHARHAFVPASNDHARAQRKHKGVAAVQAGVELGTLLAILVEPAGVVNRDLLAGGGDFAIAVDGVFVLRPEADVCMVFPWGGGEKK